jgi:hypothetical protein
MKFITKTMKNTFPLLQNARLHKKIISQCFISMSVQKMATSVETNNAKKMTTKYINFIL